MSRDGCHVIRLRGPWRYEILAPRGDGSDQSGRSHVSPVSDPEGGQHAGDDRQSGRTTFAANWREKLNVDGRARVRFRRSFHLPTGLDAGLAVWLVFDGVRVEAAARLNGVLLGDLAQPGRRAEFDVTQLLDESNELVVDAELPPVVAEQHGPDGGPMGEVRLEIRGPSA